jgi:hypothetical protein
MNLPDFQILSNLVKLMELPNLLDLLNSQDLHLLPNLEYILLNLPDPMDLQNLQNF